jgi:hypothetical protein
MDTSSRQHALAGVPMFHKHSLPYQLTGAFLPLLFPDFESVMPVTYIKAFPGGCSSKAWRLHMLSFLCTGLNAIK